MVQVHNYISERIFTQDTLLKVFQDADIPLEAFIALKNYSLSYIVKKVFRQPNGEPLELLPFQAVLLDMLWNHKYPMILASRGAGKTFIMALYALLKALLVPGSKIVIVGAGFRQSKLVFNYIAQLYYASPIIQEALQHSGGPKYAVDQCSIQVGQSTISAIPLGDGEKVRGLRANVIICDEFASISEEIFEIVIQPFAAVHSDPAKRVKISNIINLLKKFDAPSHIIENLNKQLGFGNQIIISGTASYEFNHFARKYEMYKLLIDSKGDPKRIKEAFNFGNKFARELDDKIVQSFNYKDYAVFCLPYHAIPKGFMDDGVIANAKLTYDESRFGMEYLCKFAKDSDGFFKRSLIDGATPHEHEFRITIELFGEKGAQYVMGIDPARWNDNLAITILKLTQKGFEVVYCWAMRGKTFDVATEKIRELMNRFNIVHIAMDREGGGSAIMDLLSNKNYIKAGEQPIFEVENDETRFFAGKHILECFQWSPAWIREANYALKTELLHKHVLFPSRVDEQLIFSQYKRFYNLKSEMTKAQYEWCMSELYGARSDDGDKIGEGVVDNIEELKNEMCAIIVKVTENGTESFILPPLSVQQKTNNLSDARRRDRYSSILLAAYAARNQRGTGHKPKSVPGGSDTYFRQTGFGRSNIGRNGGTIYPVY